MVRTLNLYKALLSSKEESRTFSHLKKETMVRWWWWQQWRWWLWSVQQQLQEQQHLMVMSVQQVASEALLSTKSGDTIAATRSHFVSFSPPDFSCKSAPCYLHFSCILTLLQAASTFLSLATLGLQQVSQSADLLLFRGRLTSSFSRCN